MRGKWLFFISFPSLRVLKRRLASGWALSTSLPSELVSLERSHGVRRHTTTFWGSSPPSDEVKVLWVGVKVPLSCRGGVSNPSLQLQDRVCESIACHNSVYKYNPAVRATTSSAAPGGRGQKLLCDTLAALFKPCLPLESLLPRGRNGGAHHSLIAPPTPRAAGASLRS